jgi:hypothetical protein
MIIPKNLQISGIAYPISMYCQLEEWEGVGREVGRDVEEVGTLFNIFILLLPSPVPWAIECRNPGKNSASIPGFFGPPLGASPQFFPNP